MSDIPDPLNAWCINNAMRIATRVFKSRVPKGHPMRHEVHLTLPEFQAILQTAMQETVRHVVDAIEKAVEAQDKP